MAAVVVQSRFAGLDIEDDDYPQASSDVQKKKKNIAPAPAAAKKPDPAKKKNPPAKTQNASQSKKKKSKSGQYSSEQWEQWKQKDEELVDGNFEDELHQAILLSKLDFEQKKDVYKQLKKEAELEQKSLEQAAKNTKKLKKKNVMSLDQFTNMVTAGEHSRVNHDPEAGTDNQKTPQKDTEFFERVKHETKNELLKDKIIDRVKNRLVASDEVITRGQFADALEKKDIEIETLKMQVQSLKDELLMVKSRNKKLCNILGQGEMRDKAQVLVEVERLRGVQAELTAEVEALHGALERERSRHEGRDKKKKGSSSEKEK